MEAWLNVFVRFIALLERMGNALGTLAFVWATVVVLGGFSEKLGDDFWFATVIVFLEAFRAFSRQSRSDDQLLFKTTGGIKLKRVELGTSSRSLYYVNAVIMWSLIILPLPFYANMLLLVIVNMLGFYKLVGYMSRKESHILWQLSPAAAILLPGLVSFFKGYGLFPLQRYVLLPLWFMIYILARFGSPGDHCRYHRGVKVAAKVLRAIFLLATAVYLFHSQFNGPEGLVILLGPLLLGNLQIPMALARIFLSWGCLFFHEIAVHDTHNGNVVQAVKVLYIMVLCQGILYTAACILEAFSFLPRRLLALDCGLVYKLGMQSVDLYYEQAYDTFLQESLFDTTKKMGLVTFAVDSLNSGASRNKKRAAVRILDSFLQRHKTASSSNTELVSLITTSTKAVTTLISMLGWTVPEDAEIRLFAAKVTAQLAPYLLIVGIPGTMQMVSSLLDTQDEPMTEDISAPIVDGNGGNADNQQISNGSSSPTVIGNGRVVDGQEIRHGSSHSPLDIEGGNAPAVQASSSKAERNSEGCSLIQRIHRFWRHVEELWSIPREESKDRDSLPALGMQIVEGLAHDLHNCAEISRATEIIPKSIGFISCITGTTAAKREKIDTSSLALVAKLASVKGEIGITLRQELSENPFLIGNLAEILEFEGSSSYLQQSELAMDIIAKLAMDKKTRQKIGRIQVIIDKLVKGFLGGDESLRPQRAAAGEALAMLAMESPDNCSAMLAVPSYELIGDLAKKLEHGEHVYTAASLLQSLCENCRQVLRNQGPSDHLSSTLTVVLGRITNAEGKQMVALVGLASEICSVMSEGITPVPAEFQRPQDGEGITPVPESFQAFAVKLVGELNAHKKPTPAEFPNIRTRLVGLAVSIVELCPRYAPIFREHRMVEALSKVEQYMVFFGSAGEEPAGALPTLVARAKLLISANTAPV